MYETESLGISLLAITLFIHRWCFEKAGTGSAGGDFNARHRAEEVDKALDSILT